MSKIVWKGSTTAITLGKEILLRDEASGEIIADATVVATMYNESQQGIVVGTYSMTPVTTPKIIAGSYVGVVPYDESNLEIGDKLRIEIFADAGSAKRLTIAMKAVVKMRTA